MNFTNSFPLILFLCVIFIIDALTANNAGCNSPSSYKSMSRLQGNCPPIFIPFTNNGSVNLDVIPQYLKYLSQRGVKCIFAATEDTDGVAVGMADRLSVTKKCIEVAKRYNMIIVGEVGVQSIQETLQMTSALIAAGVDAIATLPETYYVTNATEDIVAYLERIIKIAYPTPVLYFDLPTQSRVKPNMPKLFSEASKLKGFGGVLTDFLSGLDIISSNQLSSNLTILTTSTTCITATYFYGLNGTSGVGNNLFPKTIQRITDLTKSGDHVKARDLQFRYNKVFGQILSVANVDLQEAASLRITLPVYRYAFSESSGINIGFAPSPPFKKLTSQQMTRIKAIINANKSLD